MTVEQLPLAERTPGLPSSSGPTWTMYGPSRIYRQETVLDLWDRCRTAFPSKRLDINERTLAALVAAGKPIDGAHVNRVVADGCVWVLLDSNKS